MTSAPIADRYLSYAKAAEKLDLTVNALKQRVKRGTMPSWTYTYSLGVIRFIASALDEFMKDPKRAAVVAEIHAATMGECRGPRHLKEIETRRMA